MNCLAGALYVRLNFGGKLTVTHWQPIPSIHPERFAVEWTLIPHVGVRFGDYVIHYRVKDPDGPYSKLWFDGEWRADYMGSDAPDGMAE